MPNLEENGEWYIKFLSLIVVCILDCILDLFVLESKLFIRIELISFADLNLKSKEGGRYILGGAEKKNGKGQL